MRHRMIIWIVLWLAIAAIDYHLADRFALLGVIFQAITSLSVSWVCVIAACGLYEDFRDKRQDRQKARMRAEFDEITKNL